MTKNPADETAAVVDAGTDAPEVDAAQVDTNPEPATAPEGEVDDRPVWNTETMGKPSEEQAARYRVVDR